MSSPAAERLRVVERQLALIQEEIAGVRHELSSELSSVVAPPAPTPVPPPVVPMAPPGMPPLRRPTSSPPGVVVGTPRPVAPRREIDLLSPGTLAWAGGVALLLGVVFFFVMAVNRGWVSPGMRVTFGALLSAGLVGTGVMLRARIGQIAASTVAAGAGMASAFVTVIAATRIYGFADAGVGMGLALVIAAGAAWLADRWDDEALAGFGLVGAIATAPIIESGITTTSAWFVLIALGAAAALGIERGWIHSGVAATAAALPQMLWLANEHRVGSDTFGEISVTAAPAGVIAVMVTTWLVLLGAGVGAYLRSEPRALGPLSVGALGAGLLTAVLSTLMLFAHGVPGADPQGVVFLILAGVYGLIGAAVLRVGESREIALVLGATALALFAAGLGELTSGAGRVAAFSAQGALLSWLAMRVREPRMRIAAAVELGLAAIFALSRLSPDAFFMPSAVQLSDTVALWCVALGVAVAVWASQKESWADTGFAVAAGGVLYALSFSILGLLQHGTVADAIDAEGAFQRGHTVVSVTWGLLGLATLIAGLRRSERWMRAGGLALLALSLGKLVLFDLANLDAMARALSFLLVGGVLIAAAAAYSKLSSDDERPGEEVASTQVPLR